jgi:hypothetical protein
MCKNNLQSKILNSKSSILFLVIMVCGTANFIAQTAAQGTDDWMEQIEMLRSVPYVDVSQTAADDDSSGVVLFDRNRVCPGYNLYCTRFSGQAFLMDMEGRVVHKWQYLSIEEGGSYHHVVLLENGDLLAIKQHSKLLRLDWDSNICWEKRYTVHHDLAPAPDGTIYAIVRDHQIYRRMRVWFDAIVHLSSGGEELRRWSTFDHLAELKTVLDNRSFLDTVLDSALAGRPEVGKEASDIKAAIAKGRYDFDYFHLNSISLIPDTPSGRKDSRFKEGNLLVCFRNVNQIAILEKGSRRLQWAWGEGQLEWPHHPTMLASGRILVFDNGVRRKYSRVVELDPISGNIVWEYPATAAADFYSEARGSAQRLANGNTLICESDRGRAFEVGPGGEVVWSWLNPDTQGGRRMTVYRMTRLPGDVVEPLLHHWWWYLKDKN